MFATSHNYLQCFLLLCLNVLNYILFIFWPPIMLAEGDWFCTQNLGPKRGPKFWCLDLKWSEIVASPVLRYTLQCYNVHWMPMFYLVVQHANMPHLCREDRRRGGRRSFGLHVERREEVQGILSCYDVAHREIKKIFHCIC